MNKLIISLSPHAHGNDSVEKNMYGVIIALVPAILVSFFYFGLGSVVVLLSSVAACVFLEWAISKYILKTAPSIADGSAIVTGLLLGMNLPSNLPVWIVLIGAVVAIGIGKMTFGGLGNNPFNPALVGRCFLLAYGWATDKLRGRGNRRHPPEHHEARHTERRPYPTGAIAQCHAIAVGR